MESLQLDPFKKKAAVIEQRNIANCVHAVTVRKEPRSSRVVLSVP